VICPSGGARVAAAHRSESAALFGPGARERLGDAAAAAAWTGRGLYHRLISLGRMGHEYDADGKRRGWSFLYGTIGTHVDLARARNFGRGALFSDERGALLVHSRVANDPDEVVVNW